jgi:hypothetical protein
MNMEKRVCVILLRLSQNFSFWGSNLRFRGKSGLLAAFSKAIPKTNRVLGIALLFLLSLNAFSDELDIAEQFIKNNAILTDYSVLDLNFNIPNTKTFFFYKPYAGGGSALNDAIIPFTDGLVIKIQNETIVQYLIINGNGLVKTNDNITFYDFSDIDYSTQFNGWLFRKVRRAFGIDNPNCFTIELTKNGIDRIAADPPLPIIIWDFEQNYPVKDKLSMDVDPPVSILKYEWREDIRISIARTGLRNNDIFAYLNNLINYDKRVIINAMFALRGYEFKTAEWRNFFSRFLWYKPNSEVINSVEILDEYQKKLFEYLTN